MLKLGNTAINKLYLGSTEIKKAYLGSTLVYDKTIVGTTYLLDTYSAVAAYSLRKLKSTAIYSCRIIRTGDAAIAKVILDDNNSLTSASLLDIGGTLGDWIIGRDVHIEIFYDQSGNSNDATEFGIIDLKPTLAVNGVLKLTNLLTSLDFGDFRRLDFTALNLATYSIFSVYEPPIAYTNALHYLVGGGNLGFSVGGTSTSYGNILTFDGSNIFQGNTKSINQNLIEYYNNSIFLNSLEDIPYKNTDIISNMLISRIGNRTDFNLPFNGRLQELIIFDNDQISNRIAISQDLKSFYNTP